jgi:hypothetical protein
MDGDQSISVRAAFNVGIGDYAEEKVDGHA